MKKITIILGAVLFSASISAKATDFSSQDLSGLHHKEMDKCLCKAWKAAKPTDEQKEAAKPFADAVKAAVEEHKADIENAKTELHEAWSNHPVNRDDVMNAEQGLKDHVTPVMDAYRDNGIEILNLLSAEQHKKFSDSFKKCMHGDDHGLF